jgi:hypothetical protein
MALISVGSIGKFSVVARPAAMKKLEAAGRIKTFSVLAEVSGPEPVKGFDFAVSKNRRGLALQSLQLKKEFQDFVARLFHRSSKLYFLAWAWDMSGLRYYPGETADPGSCLIPLKGGELREFIGAGAILFEPRPITAGLALRIQIWESKGGRRKFGEVMAKVASTIKESDLNTALLGLATGAAAATGGAAGAFALVEPAALELAKIIGEILAKSADESVDYFEGYFPATDPWPKDPGKYDGHGSTIVLNRMC